MIRKFMQCVAAALCCLPAVSIAASGDPQELERQLAKIRSEPMIFVVATGEPNACGGCHLGFPLDDACRHLMQSKREHKARLYSGGARCASACVYAMVGASTRRVEAPRFEFIPAWAAKSTRPRILCGATSWAWASTRPLLMPPLRFPLAPSGG
jgi:hypothetical protein